MLALILQLLTAIDSIAVKERNTCWPGAPEVSIEADVVVRDLGYAPRVDSARDRLHVHDLAFKAAEKILKVLSCHFVTPFLSFIQVTKK